MTILRIGTTVVLGSAILCTGQVQGQINYTFDASIRSGASTFAEAAGARTIAILDFPTLDNRITQLGIFVSEQLTTDIAQAMAEASTGGRVVERRQVLQILEEERLTAYGLTDSQLSTVAAKLGATAVVIGTATVIGEDVVVNARLVDVDGASVIAASRISGSTAPEFRALDRLTTGGTPRSSDQSPVAPPDISCASVASSTNRYLRADVTICPTISPDGRTIAFTLTFTNITTREVLYIGAGELYGGWLKVVDNTGGQWEGDQWSITRLPTDITKHFIELEPGADFSVNVSVEPTTGRPPEVHPSSISITAELVRRTESEQRQAAQARTSLGHPDGRPIPMAIRGVPVRRM